MIQERPLLAEGRSSGWDLQRLYWRKLPQKIRISEAEIDPQRTPKFRISV